VRKTCSKTPLQRSRPRWEDATKIVVRESGQEVTDSKDLEQNKNVEMTGSFGKI
jgi:hypothetical protein